MNRRARRPVVVAAALALVAPAAVAALAVGTPAASAHKGGGHHPSPPSTSGKAVFFASDGMRQDLVEKYADQGVMPTMRKFLKNGVKARGDGMLTQAPPNTGAGWYTMATGAWPGVTGSTNNTFHKNGDPFGTSRTAAFDPGVLQAESIAQAAERGGLKVAQMEWAGGRNASIQGPTIDFQTFSSGRGVTTNFIGQKGDELFDDAAFIASFGLQFDHPAGYAGRDAVPGAPPPPRPPAGPACRGRTARRRRCGCGCSTATVDKYGLNAYIYDSRNDRRTNYDRVLFSPTKNGADAVGDLKQGQWADVKVTIDGGALAGKTAGMLVKVETLSPDLSRVRLFHTSVTRAIATWPTWPGEPGYTEFDEYLAAEFPTSTAADFADPRGRRDQRGDLRRAGPLLVHRPLADARVHRRDLPSPTCSWSACRPPTSSSTSSWAWSASACPTVRPTRRTTTWTSTASRTDA